MKNSLFLAAVLFIFSALPAKAFFIEPFVGYSTGSLDVTADVLIPPTSIEDSYDLKGPTYGLRAGFEPGSFQLGAEYLLSKFETSGGELVEDGEELNVEEISAFLGYRFWYMRVYLGATLEAKDKDSDLEGSGIKVGLSFYPFKNMALNFDYRKVELDGALKGVLMNADYDVMSFLVSFPFSL